MDKDEFERLKAEEKEHLRKLKDLRQTHTVLSRQERLKRTLSQMKSSTRDLLDASAHLIENMQQEAAIKEARLDIATEAAAEAAVKEKAEKDLEAFDESLRRDRAQALVQRMKAALGSENYAEPAEGEGQPVHKTIGAPAVPPEQGAPESPPKTLPDKTIGRKRP